MIVPVMAISNLVLTQQIYSEETNGAHAHYRELVPLRLRFGHFTENDKLWFVVNGFTLHVCPYLGLEIPGSGRANLHDIDVRSINRQNHVS